ncbi:MFS general substrate transporter [Hymenopellis radicata]|nr:MFS general substrate transporter [Hymenopellis radicata]
MAFTAAFWLIILAINMSSFLVLLEGTIISNSLPAIASALHGTGDVWIGSAYNLTAAALMPVAGGLSQVFGRKPVILGGLLVFSLGSTLCGIAQAIPLLIAGLVQGVGGAGVYTTTAIILSDLVPLSNRGVFNGIYQMTWCLASAAGPIVGGSLASPGSWRWIFFLNLPLSLPAMILLVVFLRLKTPHKKLIDALTETDWVGMFLVPAASVSLSIALVWSGATYEWSSWHVLVPFSFGIMGFIGLIVYEIYWASHPLIPVRIMTNRTTLSGYLQIFIVPIPFLAVIYYMPIYFQVSKELSSTQSGLALFGVAISTPLASVVTGLLINRTQKYRPEIWTGWISVLLAFSLLSTIHEGTPMVVVVVYEVVLGTGFGMLFAALYFPVLAPLPLSSAAAAISFFSFLRMLAQVHLGYQRWGAVLQSEVMKRLPASDMLDPGSEFMKVVTIVATLDEPLRSEVKHTFSEGLSLLWKVMTGISAVGMIASFAMQHVELPTSVDADWGMEERRRGEGQEP